MNSHECTEGCAYEGQDSLGCHPQACHPPPLRQLSVLEITDGAVMGDQQGLRMLWFLPSPCWGYSLLH